MRPDGLIYFFKNMASQNQPGKDKNYLGGKIIKEDGGQAWWQPALMLFFRLSVWIAVPVVIAVFIGKWLDKKYDSAPWLFLGCVGAAFFISMIGLIKNTMQEYKKIEKNLNNKKE